MITIDPNRLMRFPDEIKTYSSVEAARKAAGETPICVCRLSSRDIYAMQAGKAIMIKDGESAVIISIPK